MSTLRTVFIGPPGSGKGTQAFNLKRDYCVCHLSTGDMLRENIEKGTELGKKAKEAVSSGALVADELIIGMIGEAIKQPDCKTGFILDGFPRTVPQAEKLDEMLKKENATLDRAFEFAIEDSLLVKRISGRRVHLSSGRVYHVDFSPPKVPGKDDVTGEPLTQRPDDNAEVLQKRLDSYHKYTAPVVSFYKKKDLLTVLDASKKPTDVFSTIQSALNAIGKKEEIRFINSIIF